MTLAYISWLGCYFVVGPAVRGGGGILTSLYIYHSRNLLPIRVGESRVALILLIRRKRAEAGVLTICASEQMRQQSVADSSPLPHVSSSSWL